MSFVTGNATDHADLFAKLKAFLQTDAALVADGAAWTTAWAAPAGAASPSDIVLRGPGLSGDDNVFVGMRLVVNPDSDTYWIETIGMTGILAGAQAYDEHAGVAPYPVRMFLDDQPMTYWFVASGRRFMAVVKISTVFEAMYAGLFLPYGDPVSYPYPMFIGGSSSYAKFERDSAMGSNGQVKNGWRSVQESHRHFTSPMSVGVGQLGQVRPAALMLSPSGEWLQITAYGGNFADNSLTDPAVPVGMHPEKSFGGVFQSTANADGTSGNVQDLNNKLLSEDIVRQKMAPCYGGAFSLMPITLIQKTPSGQTYGVLDGAYRVPGVNNSSENIITIDGDDHLVVQNVFRTGIGDYWALALEGVTDPVT
jgi:hypothetical protein